MPQKEKKYCLADLSNAVCIASGIKDELLFSRNKDITHAIARGVFYMLAREYGHLFREIASYANRHHSTCVNVAKRFTGYCEVKDPAVCSFVAQVRQILSGIKRNSNE